MKLLLLVLTCLFLNTSHADIFSLPDSAFSVDITTGEWIESAAEGKTRRIWDGKKWHWLGKPDPLIHEIKDKKLTQVKIRNRAPITYGYSKAGDLTLRREGRDHFLEIAYDSQRKVFEQRAPLTKDGRSTTMAQFRYSERKTEVTDALGFKKLYYWNKHKEITDIEHYGSPGVLIKREHFEWDRTSGTPLLTKQVLVNEKGETVLTQENKWDALGRITKQTLTGDLTGHGQKESYSQTLIYGANGDLSKVIEDNGHIRNYPLPPVSAEPASFIFDGPDGNIIEKTFADGHIESYGWDQYGNLISRTTSKDGKEEKFTYDFMNRLIRESDGFAFEYDVGGRQVKRIDPEGNETEFVYDALGRMIEMKESEVLDPEGNLVRPTTKWVYNALDQIIETTDPDGWVTKTSYTARGQVSRVEYPDGRVVETFYHKSGLPANEPDKPAVKEEETSEPSPEMPLEVEPGETTAVTDRIINDRGQTVLQKTFVDFMGIKSVRTFDALGRVEKVEKYDIVGKLFLTKDFRYTPGGIKAYESVNSHTVEWTWGPQERLDALIENRGKDSERITRLYYNNEGKLAHFVKPSGLTLNYEYDSTQTLSRITSSDGSIDHQFIWNEAGRLVGATDKKTGTTTSRSYDEKGRLVKETLGNGLTIIWEDSALVLPDGSRIRYTRDDKEILRSISRENSSGDVLYTHNYTQFDAYGQLIEEEMILDLGKTVYQRDNEQRITSIVSPYRSEKITYDGLKLTEIDVNGTKSQFAYDEQFRLKRSTPLEKVEFDLDGNIVKTDAHTLKYDGLGRLVDVDGLYQYEYDPFGRRITRHDSKGETSHYIWDGMEEIGSTDSEKTIQELKIMGPLGPSFGPVAVEINQEAWAVLSDAKGSISELVGNGNTPPKSPWTYQGKRQDKETGFIYFGARFLDPQRGQFLTPDPKGYEDGHDVYQFARYNPHAYSDTWGHQSIMNGFKSLVKTGWNAFVRLHQKLTEWRSWMDNMTGMSILNDKFESLAISLISKGFLTQTGFYNQPSQTGVFGNGEIDSHVRVTFNHGILNIRSDLVDNLRQISNSHGGVNVHWVFRPTKGFAWDLVKCLMVKFGYVSPEAKELVRIWKGLIDEMGGVNGGGKIVHYAHSVGGADTWAALSHLSVEEQKMLDIRTFGSATLIPEIGTYTAVNYVSKRDGVSFFDPFTYLKALVKSNSNTIFVGTYLGIPLIDHSLSVDSYQQVMRALGQAFLAAYGG